MPEQRWNTQDLDSEIVMNSIWDSWQGLMFFMHFLYSENYIELATYEDNVQRLLDIKTVIMDRSERTDAQVD